MPITKKMLYQLFTLLAAVLMLLVSCPATTKESVSDAQPVPPVATTPAVSTDTPDADAAEPKTAGVVSEPVANESAVEETKLEEEAADDPPEDVEEDTTPEEKPPMSKNYRPVEKKKTERPKKPASRMKSFVSVEMRLLSADFNPAEDATLSKLAFEFRANLGRMKKIVKTVEIDSISDSVCATLDLELCKLEIYPLVQPPELDGHGSLGTVGLRSNGMYHIKMYSNEDELIGIFGIRSDGEFSSAPMMERPEGFLIKAIRRPDSYAPVPYTVYTKAAVGERPDYLVTIQFNGGGFEQSQVEDPDGNLYDYYFPAGRLELYDPNEE